VPPHELDLEHVLQTKLDATLMGEDVQIGMYVWNGYRLIGAAADLPTEALSSAAARFRVKLKLDRKLALESAVPTGYEPAFSLESADILASVAQLASASGRMIQRLFWPVVSGKSLDALRQHGLASAAFRGALRDERGTAPTGDWRHAYAVATHNAAIAAELGFPSDGDVARDELWAEALTAWGEVASSDEFWQSLKDRIHENPNSDLDVEDADTLRVDLLHVIAAFNVVLARKHAAAGSRTDSRRHIQYLRNGKISEDAKSRALGALASQVGAELLEPLRQRAHRELGSLENKIPRRTLAPKLDPVVEQAVAAAQELKGLFGDVDTARLGLFDAVATEIRAGVARLDFQGDDRWRTLLYCGVVEHRLRTLPLSTRCALDLERAKAKTLSHLYPHWDLGNVDPFECWFVPDEVPDPDSSFEFAFHKITNREVLGDTIRTTWIGERVIVPRSKLAAQSHQQGEVVINITEAEVTPLQRSQWERANELERELKNATERLKQELDRELTALERNGAMAAASVKQAAIAEKEKFEREARAAEADYQRQSEQLDRDRSVRIQALRAAAERARAAAAAKAKAAVEKNQGLRGFSRLELPMLAVSILLTAAGLVVAPDQSGPGAFTLSEMSLTEILNGLGEQPIFVGAVLAALLIPFPFGQIVRQFRRNAARRGPAQISAEEKRQVTQLTKDFEERIRVLRASCDQITSRAPRSPKELKDEIREETQRRVVDARNRYDQKLERLRSEAQHEIKTIRNNFSRRVLAAPEKKKNDHPALRAIRAKGFQAGPRP
jgi:hypothetical protein